jgi:hypothetical protein
MIAWAAAEEPGRLVRLVCRMHARFASLREHRLRHVDDDRTPQNSLDSATLESGSGRGVDSALQVQRGLRSKELQPSASPCGRAHLIADYTFAFSSKRMALPSSVTALANDASQGLSFRR